MPNERLKCAKHPEMNATSETEPVAMCRDCYREFMKEPSVDAILRCLDRMYHPQMGPSRDHPLDVLENAGVVSSERVSAALSDAQED